MYRRPPDSVEAKSRSARGVSSALVSRNVDEFNSPSCGIVPMYDV